MSKQAEMEDIYRSYEWLLREKLEQLDVLSRKMFSEMGVFSIPMRTARGYVQQKFKQLVIDVTEEGDKQHVNTSRRLRSSKAKHS